MWVPAAYALARNPGRASRILEEFISLPLAAPMKVYLRCIISCLSEDSAAETSDDGSDDELSGDDGVGGGMAGGGDEQEGGGQEGATRGDLAAPRRKRPKPSHGSTFADAASFAHIVEAAAEDGDGYRTIGP